jgi:hypothetical protein
MAIPYYSSSMFITYLDGDKAWDLIERKAMGYDVDMDELYPEHFITEVTSVKYLENILPLLFLILSQVANTKPTDNFVKSTGSSL